MRIAGLFASAAAIAGCAGDADEVSAIASAIDIDAFQLPTLAAAERAPIVRAYDSIDPTDEVPRGLLEDAIVYFDWNRDVIPQTGYFVVVDLAAYSGDDRFWLVDVVSGEVEKHKVAHGDGSDPDNDGYATLFGNVEGSHKSSLGFALTGEIYDGTHPHSMRLDGLSREGSPNEMANTNMRDRLIVVHEASYVDDSNTGQQGRSNGCLALDPSIEDDVVDRIAEGSLIYAATSELAPPVGRATCGDGQCDGAEDRTDCPDDCDNPPSDDPDDSEDDSEDDAPDGTGGCAAGGGDARGAFALLLLGVALARRRGARARHRRRSWYERPWFAASR